MFNINIVNAYIALGGNIGEVRLTLLRAIAMLAQKPIIRIVAISKLYQTGAVGGPSGQPDYLNTAVRVQTSLSAHDLLTRCQEIETVLGRVRNERWGPRTIDLDLLVYGDEVVDDDRLQLPHPRLADRLFVLAPLADIAPKDLKPEPNSMTLEALIRRTTADQGVSIASFRDQTRVQWPWELTNT
jgi:2-amino-4-hydroxy-6-hydroxymethyldihydropteridine diphosphokinase